MLVGVLLGALFFRRPGDASGASAEVLRETLASEFRGLREEQARQLRESREELSGSLLRFSEHTGQQHQALTTATENRLAQLKNQIDESARSNREELTKTLETIRTTVEKRLELLQADNARWMRNCITHWKTVWANHSGW